jgi:hypothetical protein
MIINIHYSKEIMVDKKGYTRNDLDDLIADYTKFIAAKYEELNKDKNITCPTDQELNEFLENKIENLTGRQCKATYNAGKNKGGRCQATPHPGSKYCLKHIKQDEKYKRAHELCIKSVELPNEELDKLKIHN